MALVNKAFSVSVAPGMMPPVIHVSEYDIGRSYTVTINGENGEAFTIPTGATASVEGTLNNKVGFSESATIDGNTVSFALTESMTAYSGKAWCKVKLVLNDEPIQTCAFVLAVDRAGVEAGTVIGAPGFEEQIVDAVQDWLEEHPPAAGGMTEEIKQALLDCFENVAWINEDGQDYYDALYAALYPPVDVLSISAVFTQGSAVIYDTDSLDTLKQYLVVTATMTDSTTQTLEDTDYTLSGTLTVGTSTITVSYGGKTTTFNVTVSTCLLLNDILTLDGIKNTRNGHDASATTWEDLSGNNHDFAKISNVIWTDKSSVFNGSDTGFSNSGDLLPATLTEFTIEVSVKIGNIGTSENGYPVFAGNGNSFEVRDDIIAIIKPSGKGLQAVFGVGTTAVCGDGIAHVTFVFTGGKINRYVNGTALNPGTVAYNTSALGKNTHYVGYSSTLNNRYFTGEIYRIGVQGRAFTAEEIAARYEKLSARFG